MESKLLGTGDVFCGFISMVILFLTGNPFWEYPKVIDE